MSPGKKRDSTGLLIAGAAGLGALYLWSQQQAAAQAVDPRWLAQQELARRQGAGSPTAGRDTLSMILKLGGSAVALGSSAYGILSKIFSTGTESDALTAVTRLVQDGPGSLVPSSPVSLGTAEEIVAMWNATPPQVPGIPIADAPPVDLTVQVPGSDIAEIVSPPIDAPLSVAPGIDPGMTIPSYDLLMPGSLFSPSALEGSTGAILLQQDGLVRLSLTTDEVEQASKLVSLWERGDLDLSLLPADKAKFLEDNLPTLKKFTESGDFAAGAYDTPVSGDTLMQAMPEGAPTEWSPSFSLSDILDTVLWETRTIDSAGNTIVQLTTVADVLNVVGSVATIVTAAVSMYFTITGDLPDYQKAIYCALDAASIALSIISLAAIAIPVAGWVIAAAIQIVKFVLQKVLAGSKSHEQREAEETAILLSKAQELGKELIQTLTLRQLYATLAAYSSGYVGGTRDICIAVGVSFPDGSWKPVGAIPGPNVLTMREFVYNVSAITVRIQGGVAPENLAAADASLKGSLQQIIPIMLNARIGDLPSTQFLVNRALTLWLPESNPLRRDARRILSSLDYAESAMPIDDYPAWREVIEQTAFTLQAIVWRYPSWLAMVNDAINRSSSGPPIDISTMTAADITDLAARYGFPTFHAWRRAFFSFTEPVSLALIKGAIGMDKVYDMQKQIELLATAMLGAQVTVSDYDDLANALHAAPSYAGLIKAVFVPDYSISESWTTKLTPYQVVGVFRLPTTGQWEFYQNGAWNITTFADVVARVQSGAWHNIFHRNLYQPLGIPDPNDSSRVVPNPVFLVPNIAPYF